jgi:hypothetical protein|tara:strand:- start:1848 stop:2027 length:180 start_codon:yes stop_codon:yes gene_type:complete
MSYEWIIEKDTQEWEVKAAYNKYLKAKKSSNNHIEYNRWFEYWFDYLHTRDKFINRYEK